MKTRKSSKTPKKDGKDKSNMAAKSETSISIEMDGEVKEEPVTPAKFELSTYVTLSKFDFAKHINKIHQKLKKNYIPNNKRPSMIQKRCIYKK